MPPVLLFLLRCAGHIARVLFIHSLSSQVMGRLRSACYCFRHWGHSGDLSPSTHRCFLVGDRVSHPQVPIPGHTLDLRSFVLPVPDPLSVLSFIYPSLCCMLLPQGLCPSCALCHSSFSPWGSLSHSFSSLLQCPRFREAHFDLQFNPANPSTPISLSSFNVSFVPNPLGMIHI